MKLFNNKIEVWKQVTGFERYFVSTEGNVMNKGKRLKKQTDKQGYHHVVLYNGDGDKKLFKVHRLVCSTFLGEIEDKMVINHINADKKDNRLENLEVVTVRENMTHSNVKRTKTSKYRGVSYKKSSGKWYSQIMIAGKVRSLGVFEDEEDAHVAYETALENWNRVKEESR